MLAEAGKSNAGTVQRLKQGLTVTLIPSRTIGYFLNDFESFHLGWRRFCQELFTSYSPSLALSPACTFLSDNPTLFAPFSPHSFQQFKLCYNFSLFYIFSRFQNHALRSHSRSRRSRR